MNISSARLSRPPIALMIVIALFCVAIGAQAQPVPISGSMMSGSSVSNSFQVSSDGRYAVFIADREVVGRNEVYSVRLGSGGTITNLSTVVAGGIASMFRITPDGSRVVFLASAETAGVNEIFSIPIGGGTRTKLSGTITPGGALDEFLIAPDSSRIVFTGTLENAAVKELFSAPIASANSRTKLSGTISAVGGNVIDARISPNSDHVVFTGDLDVDNRRELFSAPIATANSRTKISGSTAADRNVFQFQISPDSSRVVFLGDLEADEDLEIFSVPLSGGTRVKVSASNIPNGDAILFQITPDSARVVFRGDLSTDEIFDVYSAPITGGSRTTLTGTNAVGGSVNNALVSPDGTRVVFIGDLETLGSFEVFSVPIGGGPRVKISVPVAPSPSVTGFAVLISPDSTRVAYLGNFENAGTSELFIAPIATANSQVKLSDAAVAGGNVTSFAFRSDGSRVVFRGDLSQDEVFELYSAPISGSGRTTLSGPLVSGGDVTFFTLSPDGGRVIFRADKIIDNRFELFRTQIGGSALSMDFDGDDEVLPLTDVLLLARYQLGMRGIPLVTGAVGANATITSPAAIENRIRAALEKAQ